MNAIVKVIALGAVVGAVAVAARQGGPVVQRPGSPAAVSEARRPIPRLVDVGAGKCIPCKAMAPILAQLRTDFAGRMEVEFVDVWVNPDAGQPYAIRVIPTQIFYGADGKELSRHEGFMSREQILARWKSHGLPF
jgi:thioredoxin 1